MISPERFYQHLSSQGVDFFTGVPDSLLKNLLAFFQEKVDLHKHVITANEGLAIALAAGYHLSTGKLPLVYMQNSGLGNAINPLTSLTDKEIYSIPLLLLIGWRGMPGKKDEPQHKKMGRITEGLLKLMEIPVFILEEDEEKSFHLLNQAITTAQASKQAVAILVKDDLFEGFAQPAPQSTYQLTREEVLKLLLAQCTHDEIIVCTTGKTGREVFEINQQFNKPLKKTFLSVGAMGLANHVALAMDSQNVGKIIMIDGDGAVLMHMGSLATIGKLASSSFIHVVLNNGSHQSVGAQPTLGFETDLCTVATGCGYNSVQRIENEQALNHWLQNGLHKNEKQFVEIRVNNASRDDIGRPSNTPFERKEALMNELLRNK